MAGEDGVRPVGKIRVAHIITRLIIGGAQENTLFTVEGLMTSEDFEPLLITGPPIGPEGELVQRARSKGVNLVIVPELRREIHPIRDSLSLLKLIRLLREFKPDIVHTHSSKAGILGRLAARLVGTKVIVHTIHGLPFHPYQSRLLNALFIVLERTAARWTDCLVTVADAMWEKAIKVGIAPRRKFRTIYSGIEVEGFLKSAKHRAAMRRKLGFSRNDIVIGKVARLFHLKGHEYLFEAFPIVLDAFPRAKLLLVGDGILRRRLERMAERLGFADKVRFAGLVDPSLIPAYISAMDVVVHASLREGLARVLPQALLCGKPVVSYDIDGAREVIIDGETGRLVPPQSVGPLANAIIEILSNRAAARRMAERGRKLCAERFPVEKMVAALKALYHDLLFKRAPESYR